MCRYLLVGTSAPKVLGYLGADSVVDSFVERTTRGVDREVFVVLLEQFNIVAGQSGDFIDVADLLVGSIRTDLSCSGREHAGKVLVVTYKSTVKIPLSIGSLLLGFESVVIELLTESTGSLRFQREHLCEIPSRAG